MSLKGAPSAADADAELSAAAKAVSRTFARHATPVAKNLARLALSAKRESQQIEASEVILKWIKPEPPRGPFVVVNQQNLGVSRLDLPFAVDGSEEESLLALAPKPRERIKPAPFEATVKQETTVPGQAGELLRLPQGDANESVEPSEAPRQTAEPGTPRKKVDW